MTFAELFDALVSRGALTLAPQKKSALRKLATALGYATLEACPVDEACRRETSWLASLEAHFDAHPPAGKTISAYTRRNTRSDLRTIFRLASAHGLLAEPLLPTLLTPTTRHAFEREHKATSPYKGSYPGRPDGRYRLRHAEWPPGVQAGWQAYRLACGRRIRDTTLAGYVRCLETFFGYLLNICTHQPEWHDLFDVGYLNDFVTWHAARLGHGDVSAHGWHVVIGAAAIAKVCKDPHADEVLAFSRTVACPPVLHRKRLHHLVSLKELDRIANACIADGRRPYLSHPKVQSPGVRGATRFQRGLMLKLLTRIPMRSRNLREMRLGKNLFQDRAGHWHLEFRGTELKVGKRAGRTNEYLFDLTQYCPPDTDDLLPALEEFLTVYRPRIPNTTAHGPVFMTQIGTPYDVGSLRAELATIVARYTGQRFHPHIIRSIWGSEYLEEHPGDFATVAEMLGNTVDVVIKTYYDVVPKAQQAKASTWLAGKFGGGALKR
jgi:integrase